MLKWALTTLMAGLCVAPSSAQNPVDPNIRLPRGVRGADLSKILKPIAGPFAIRAIKDVAYRNGDDADRVRHKLDLYIPVGAKDFPVLFFVHGGAWRSGNKNMYGRIGELFAGMGVGSVIINYRLSGRNSRVRHPDHIEDVAKAFAWTVENIKRYGGRADRIFVSGHSAGGHLVSLLATDEHYLKAEGLTVQAVRGVIAMSGVYTELPAALFKSVFGDNPRERKKAFPITHITDGKELPPFLLMYADKDLPTIDVMSDRFHQKLCDCHLDSNKLTIENRNHITIIMGMMVPQDPVTQAIFDFIKEHAEIPKKPTEANDED